jgi:hypothetical protein
MRAVADICMRKVDEGRCYAHKMLQKDHYLYYNVLACFQGFQLLQATTSTLLVTLPYVTT